MTANLLRFHALLELGADVPQVLFYIQVVLLHSKWYIIVLLFNLPELRSLEYHADYLRGCPVV